MSARDRHLKVEQYAMENKRLRVGIGMLTRLNVELQDELNEANELLEEANQVMECAIQCLTISDLEQQHTVDWFAQSGKAFTILRKHLYPPIIREDKMTEPTEREKIEQIITNSLIKDSEIIQDEEKEDD